MIHLQRFMNLSNKLSGIAWYLPRSIESLCRLACPRRVLKQKNNKNHKLYESFDIYEFYEIHDFLEICESFEIYSINRLRLMNLWRFINFQKRLRLI